MGSVTSLGRILKDDQQTLASLQIVEGLTVNLIKTKVVESVIIPPPNRDPKEINFADSEFMMPPGTKMPPGAKFPNLQQPPGTPGNFNPQMFQEMMKNPDFAKLVKSPNFMTKMMEQNPYVK